MTRRGNTSFQEREFQVAAAALDDWRRGIAAGKVQRWDVLKWGVTVNLALATSAAVIDPNWALPILSVLVAIGCCYLIVYYNEKMTAARNRLLDIVKWMKKRGIDYDAITNIPTGKDYSAGNKYDVKELRVFVAILLFSAAPTSIVWSLKTDWTAIIAPIKQLLAKICTIAATFMTIPTV